MERHTWWLNDVTLEVRSHCGCIALTLRVCSRSSSLGGRSTKDSSDSDDSYSTDTDFEHDAHVVDTDAVMREVLQPKRWVTGGSESCSNAQ